MYYNINIDDLIDRVKYTKKNRYYELFYLLIILESVFIDSRFNNLLF